MIVEKTAQELNELESPANNVVVTDGYIVCQFGSLVMLLLKYFGHFNNDTNMLCILCLVYVKIILKTVILP